MAIKLPPRDERPEYFSSEEFGAIFGRTRTWVNRMIQEGKIKVKRIGSGKGRIYIPAHQIEALLGDDAGGYPSSSGKS